MQLVISGRHTSLREGEKAVIEEKMLRYEKKLPDLLKADVVLNVEKDRHDIEVILHIAHHNPLVGHASGTTHLGALDLVIDKLDNLVEKHHGKRSDHHRNS